MGGFSAITWDFIFEMRAGRVGTWGCWGYKLSGGIYHGSREEVRDFWTYWAVERKRSY